VRLNGGQKAVVCIALAAGLLVVGFALGALLWDGPAAEGGWFNYAPNNGVVFSEDPSSDTDVVPQAAMWLALVGIWAGLSVLVLRPRAARERTPSAPATEV
jgi:hypothetical protein